MAARLTMLLVALAACGEPAEAPSDPLAAGTPAERAMVRALLDRLAAEHGPEDITDAEVRELWERRVAGQPLPERVPLEQVEAELREELVARARLQALVQLVAELERRHGVERHPEAIDRLATLPIRFEDDP